MAPGPVGAAPESPEGPRAGCASLDALRDEFLRALERHDSERLEALQQPLLDRCRSTETQDLYARVLEAEAGLQLEAEPDWVTQPVDAKEMQRKLEVLGKVAGEQISFPIPPTHMLEFTARSPHPAQHPCASQPARIRRFAVEVDGCWRIVPQCLTPSMQASMRESEIVAESVRRMQDDMLRELSDTDRQRLNELLRQRKSEAAFDLATELFGTKGKAYRLIERLCRDL